MAVKSFSHTVLCVDFLLTPFLMAGSSWLWWNDRKTEAQWWHRVEERWSTLINTLKFSLHLNTLL